MKLQTMTLPTGEFLLIASELRIPESAQASTVEQFRILHERAGAAAGWITDQPVEVENAYIDEGARRALAEIEPEETYDDSEDPDYDEGDCRGWVDVGYLTEREGNTFHAGSVYIAPLEGPQTLAERIDDVVFKSPLLQKFPPLAEKAERDLLKTPRLKIEDLAKVIPGWNEQDTEMAKQLLSGAEFSDAGLITNARDLPSERRTPTEQLAAGSIVLGGAQAHPVDVDPADIDRILAKDPEIPVRATAGVQTAPDYFAPGHDVDDVDPRDFAEPADDELCAMAPAASEYEVNEHGIFGPGFSITGAGELTASDLAVEPVSWPRTGQTASIEFSFENASPEFMALIFGCAATCACWPLGNATVRCGGCPIARPLDDDEHIVRGTD